MRQIMIDMYDAMQRHYKSIEGGQPDYVGDYPQDTGWTLQQQSI